MILIPNYCPSYCVDTPEARFIFDYMGKPYGTGERNGLNGIHLKDTYQKPWSEFISLRYSSRPTYPHSRMKK